MAHSVFTDANKVVVEALVAARKSAGLRQQDLADRLGKPQRFISRVEGGQRRVDLLEFYAIATALKFDPAELFAHIAKRLPKNVSI
jgi:transcriptional regulator with XRE-family HTH domain